MLNRVYSIFDRRLRPLRNHVYLVFPEHNFAYARVAEPAFHVLSPVLNWLAGNEITQRVKRQTGSAPECTGQSLFHGNVELLTARELKRRFPEMKVVAWVQDPAHRLSYCYEKVILATGPLPSYYIERGFDRFMSPDDFVTHVSSISDLDADNLFRSQSAVLTHKGMLIADVVLQLEHFEQSLATFLSESALPPLPVASTAYRISEYVSDKTLRSFADEGLRQKLKRRYQSDYDFFYSRQALSA